VVGDDEVGEVTGVRDDAEVEVVNDDARAVEAGAGEGLSGGADFFGVGLEAINVERAALGDLPGEAALLAADDEAVAVGDAALREGLFGGFGVERGEVVLREGILFEGGCLRELRQALAGGGEGIDFA